MGARDRDRAAFPVVLHGVGEEVQEDLGEPLPIGQDVGITAGGRPIERDRAAAGERGDEPDHLGQEVGHGDRFRRERHLPGLDPADVEDLIDELEQVPSALADVVQAVALFGGQLIHLEQLGEAENGVQGRPEFVAHPRQELALGEIRPMRLGLGRPECGVGRLAHADVDDAGQDLGPVLALDGIESHLDRDLPTVAVQSVEIAVAPHGSGGGVVQVAGPVGRMALAKAGGQQHLHRLADHLLPGIAEQPLRLRVDEVDHAALVHDDDGVGDRLHDATKPVVGEPAVGDVPGVRNGLDRCSGSVVLGPDDQGHPLRFPIATEEACLRLPFARMRRHRQCGLLVHARPVRRCHVLPPPARNPDDLVGGEADDPFDVGAHVGGHRIGQGQAERDERTALDELFQVGAPVLRCGCGQGWTPSSGWGLSETAAPWFAAYGVRPA